MKLISLLAATVVSLTSVHAAVNPINVTSNAFWDSETGERFYIRGVDYQPGGSSNLTDPLGDEVTCKRDIKYFEELGINTVRVYTIDGTLDHDACMEALQDAGIYLILDVNTPEASISRTDAKCSYNSAYLQHVFSVIDEFADYNNTLGFFAGNEVIDSVNNTDTATYVKAVVRDMKNYIKARDYRQIPVGYSAADVTSNRLLAAEYFNCGDDEMARIDMFGVNDYSWCGSSSFTVSGYSEKVALYEDYSVPIFLSEYGCNQVVSTRPFTEVQAIYSTRMSGVFSGGLVYEYSQEDNNYGLVEISDDGEVTTLEDFDNLKKQFASVSNPSGDGGAVSTNSISECPTYEAGVWEADNTLPDMPSAASKYFTSGAGEPEGTNNGGTQFRCYDDDDYEADSSSSSSGASPSSTDLSSISSGQAAASTSASSSSSGIGGKAANLPSIYNTVYSLSQGSLVVLISGFLVVSGVAVLA
jgi:hypothetical protein